MGKTGGTSRKAGRPKGSGQKRKRVTVKFIERRIESNGKVTEPYRIMEELIKTERADLKDVKIGIAWRMGWRPDADGRRTLAQVVKRGDLDRELDTWDYVILLNDDAWQTFNEKQKERLVFEKLEQCQLSLDTNGEPKRDDRGRIVCRIQKPDIVTFRSVIKRYGWEEDLQVLAEKGIADASRPLLAEAERKVTEKASATDAALSLSKEGTENTEDKKKAGKKRKKNDMAAMVEQEETEE